MNDQARRSVVTSIGAGIWRRRVAILKIVAWVGLTLAVIDGLAAFVMGRRYEAELAAIRQQGEPVTMTDLAKLAAQPVPDEDNAAAIYKKAFKIIEQKPMSKDLDALDKLANPHGEERTAKVWSDAAAVAPRFMGVLGLIEQGTAKRACYFPIRWQDGWSAQLPHYAQLRQLARVPAAFAMLAVRDGKVDEALRYIGLDQRIADCVGKDPLLIALLVRIALTTFVQHPVGELIEKCALSDAQARNAFDMLARIDLAPQQASAMLGERAFGVWTAEYMRRNCLRLDTEGGVPVLSKPGLGERIDSYLLGPLTYANAVSYLGFMKRQIDSAHVPFRDLKARGLDAESLQRETPFYAAFARIMAPALSRVRMQVDVCKAEIASEQAALALIAYKDRFGSYPGSLAEAAKKLGWKLPGDPFSGKALVYKPRGKGFIVYSVGPNLKDDGGAPPPTGKNVQSSGDIVLGKGN